MNNSLYTDQQWEMGSGESFSSSNPATEKVIWSGRESGKEQVDKAVANACRAFPEWSFLEFDERVEKIQGFGTALQERQDEFAEIISQETGKPLWEAKTEVASMIHKIDLSIEAYMERCHKVIRHSSITRHRPHGAVAVFGPYNFPGHLPNGHIIPALLAGNTVVFKPSEWTPLVGQTMIQCWEQADLPPGVINLVQGGKETGQLLAHHTSLKGLFFTGSFLTGLKLSEYYGSHPEKILALEMGGNNPLIVSQIDDLKAAAYVTIQSAFLSSGQRCSCTRRLIVSESPKASEFIMTLKELIQNIKVDSYMVRPEPFMGPLISSFHAQQVLDGQKELITKGGIPLLQCQQLPQGKAFLSPGLIDMTQAKERPDKEIFGPLLQLIRVPSFEAAIQEANNTRFGLSAGLLSTKADEYDHFYRHIKSGVINWNAPTTGASSAAPFGGVGCSGNHRPSAYYAADYCSYPVASMENSELKIPSKLIPGIIL